MIQEHGIEINANRVSPITEKKLLLIREWRNHPLGIVYAHVIMDAIRYKVREEGMTAKKAGLYCDRNRFVGYEGCAGFMDWQDRGGEILVYRTQRIKYYRQSRIFCVNSFFIFNSDNEILIRSPKEINNWAGI